MRYFSCLFVVPDPELFRDTSFLQATCFAGRPEFDAPKKDEEDAVQAIGSQVVSSASYMRSRAMDPKRIRMDHTWILLQLHQMQLSVCMPDANLQSFPGSDILPLRFPLHRKFFLRRYNDRR